MIQPNFNLMLWIMFILIGIKGIAKIISGALGREKETKYGITDIIDGIISVIIVIIILIY